MKNIKELIDAYNKLGEKIREIINKQYEEDSIYLHVENDIIKIAKVKYTTSNNKVYTDVIEIKNNHITKYTFYFDKENLLEFIEIDVRYWIIIYNLYNETCENITNYRLNQLENCSKSIKNILSQLK